MDSRKTVTGQPKDSGRTVEGQSKTVRGHPHDSGRTVAYLRERGDRVCGQRSVASETRTPQKAVPRGQAVTWCFRRRYRKERQGKVPQEKAGKTLRVSPPGRVGDEARELAEAGEARPFDVAQLLAGLLPHGERCAERAPKQQVHLGTATKSSVSKGVSWFEGSPCLPR